MANKHNGQFPNIDNIAQRRAPNQVTVARAVDADPLSAVRQATGLNITEADLRSITNDEPTTAKVAREISPGDSNSKSGLRALTPQEIQELSDDYVPIDVDKELEEAEDAKIEKHAQESFQSMEDLFDGALDEEEEREKRIVEAAKKPEEREKLVTEKQKAEAAKVVYKSDMMDDDDELIQRRERLVSGENERTAMDSEAGEEDDLMPAYDDDDDPIPVATDGEANEQNRPTPDQSDEEQADYIRNLRTVNFGNAEDDDDAGMDISSVVHVRRERATVVPSTERSSNYRSVGDQAFINAMNRYKRDKFRVITAPLINSGFSVDIVGTAPMDLTLLYAAVDENTPQADYEIEKMKTVIRNVVAANPKVKSENLRNMIHFADYQIMAYAHVCGTLKDVELIHTCDSCGKDFHIVAASTDLVLNADEMKERIQQIRSATSAGENSLLAKDERLEWNTGHTVILGHPSYHEYIRHLEELRATLRQLSSTENTRLRAIVQILPYVRSAELAEIGRTNNLYQRYLAITMLDEDEYAELVEHVDAMRRQIVVPEFGIRRVRCPHCHKYNSNIRYSDLTDLVFFHTTVSRLLKQTAR